MERQIYKGSKGNYNTSGDSPVMHIYIIRINKLPNLGLNGEGGGGDRQIKRGNIIIILARMVRTEDE